MYSKKQRIYCKGKIVYTNKIIVNHLNYLIIQDKSNCNFDSYQYYIKNASRTLLWTPKVGQ